MPITPVQFESSRDKHQAREDLREARERVLEKAKAQFDRRTAEEERARERGDDKWMLASVEARLREEPGKKSKKNKKDKKHKKKKKSKRKSSSSESESSSDSGDGWVEKGAKKEKKGKNPQENAGETSKATRDDWMMLPDLIPCTTRDEIRQSRKPKEEQEAEANRRNILDNPGQNERELNPHWKDGGSGLPQVEKSDELKLPSKTVGDQGTSWLRKALQRIYEQAEETGQSPEDIAAERWGSLEKLEDMIADAEGRKRSEVRASFSRYSRGGRGGNRPKFARPPDDFDDQKPGCSRERDHRDSGRSGYQKPRDDKDFRNCERSDSSKDKRSRERRSPDRRRRSPERSRERRDERKSPGRFQRPREDDYEGERRRRTDFEKAEKTDFKGKFQKPKEDDDSFSYSRSHKSASSSSTSSGWRKKREEPRLEARDMKEEKASSSNQRLSSPSSSSSEEEMPEPAPRLLTEKEMNEIGAKIVKAEILGNGGLAAKLKLQLEEARAAREEAKASGVNLSKLSENKEDVVILTRTDSKGFTRPVEEPKYQEPKGGRRRKQKVPTHNKQGERERYFATDDKYSLQDIYTREKLNTVEDSNNEFARMVTKGTKHAGKGEFDMDEVFEEKARMKESDAKTQARERDQAVKEHQRVNNALDHCQWCVDSKKMLKHLIVALGSKVYLCLPPYQSLTEGHCLLVPRSHATCGTMLDEDVWEEMQNFRKILTKMFLSKDEDVIFFENARNIRGFPHMVMECVPVDRDSGAMAPIYFKKAIQECEMEWATNVKLVNLAPKGLRRSIPKGLPYFAVNFGDDDGFGHVVEDENTFPPNFAQVCYIFFSMLSAAVLKYLIHSILTGNHRRNA
ncbi:Hypothetical predicted protein [Cloeon dipterum]|uniref:Cwf19-like C-terminal domain-containing protein n=1 Tax=Cloeon dipterum TaxID=197152 RepID=A0A8S1CSU6_9INSE|nr:Hypothetical predicted protein [Cloeon dipterum]